MFILLFEAQKTEIKKQLMLTQKNTFYNQWLTDLKKEIKVVDNRFQFYR